MRLLKTLLVSVLLTAACGPIPSPIPPQPPPAPVQAFDYAACIHDPVGDYCDGTTAKITLTPTTGDTPRVQVSDANGYFWIADIPASWTTVDVDITAPGYVPYEGQTTVQALVAHNAEGLHNMQLLQLDFPHPPTRDQALNICLSFQGLTVHTKQYGDLPWFEAALTWLDDPADRQAVYAAKHASKNAFCPNGDTHALIFPPYGRPLYDEPNQAYSVDRGFGARDWTNNLSQMDDKFVALVKEVREAGFIPMVFACGDGNQPENYACAMAETPLMVHALQDAEPRDLSRDVVWLPGYDGVFYGWGSNAVQTRQMILSWAQRIRADCPLCYVGIEHVTGKIPLGEGDSDWVIGGDMNTWYDLLLSEFNDDQLYVDDVYQIAARTLGPAYNRPPQQPADDDPRPPFYFRQPTPRGRLYACAFEFGLYDFVRWHYDDAHVASQRAYFVARGYTCGG